MKGLFLVAIIILAVTVIGDMFFTIPTDNPQRIFFFVGKYIVITIIYLVFTSIINKIKKKNS
ncbi:hypothetical protein BFR40_02715 [Brochothrix thermosphacta]|nr:hypothetical protein BFR40_02715 [Brochothrix thermosphacta]SPN76212.1 conserved hypothetical protein [Brochothrix thermosphacta]SPP28044.1 conserved hypothetical protein [Brochothrix thermosphacta]